MHSPSPSSAFRLPRAAPLIWRSRPATVNRHEAFLLDLFRRHVGDRKFPCVGAKSALAREQLQFYVCKNIQSAWDDLALLEHLHQFAADYRRTRTLFTSFVAIFREPRHLHEETFEHFLWQRLQSLHDKDVWLGQPADSRVSGDPESPHFSLSLGGEGFFVVGLHPAASRPARRFVRPALVFNLHDQFARLRAEGKFDNLSQTILQRDVALAGSVNPMLAAHGEISEARQYSGRNVDADWRCPFQPKRPDFGSES